MHVDVDESGHDQVPGDVLHAFAGRNRAVADLDDASAFDNDRSALDDAVGQDDVPA